MTDDLTKRMYNLRKAGLTSSQIADRLGVTRNSVIGRLWRLPREAKEYSIPKKIRVEYPDEVIDEVIFLKSRGESFENIKRKTGVGYNHVMHILSKI